MPIIHLTTIIAAPRERVFDLSRSIDLHRISTRRTQEQAIAGRMSGLIEKGEQVTWRARHLLAWRELTVEIAEMDRPRSFRDRMIAGDFRSMDHLHRFEEREDGTEMVDSFHFESPFGPVGRMVNFLFLTRYMRRLLEARNEVIREFAVTERWREVLC